MQQLKQKHNLIQIIDTLAVATASEKNLTAINMGGMDRKNALEAAVAKMLQANPQLLVGYTKENRKAYKAKKVQ